MAEFCQALYDWVEFLGGASGSSSILLHDNIALDLGISKYAISKAIGIGGMEVDAKAISLDYVIVGPFKKTNLTAHVIGYNGPTHQYYNGILGMNFLKGLEYFIDFDNKVIRWYQ